MTIASQERIIERLKEQRERDDRERLEEIESFRKENKDLKEKVNALQAELTEKEVSQENEGTVPSAVVTWSLETKLRLCVKAGGAEFPW